MTLSIWIWKSEDSHVHSTVVRCPQLGSLLDLKRFSHFEHIGPTSFEQVSFWHPLSEPHLTTCHSNIGVQLTWVTKLGMSTTPCSLMWVVCVYAHCQSPNNILKWEKFLEARARCVPRVHTMSGSSQLSRKSMIKKNNYYCCSNNGCSNTYRHESWY